MHIATLDREEPLATQPLLTAVTKSQLDNTPATEVQDTTSSQKEPAADQTSNSHPDVPLAQSTADQNEQVDTAQPLPVSVIIEEIPEEVPKNPRRFSTGQQQVREKPNIATVNNRFEKPPKLTVQVQVNGKTTRLLVDTGASVSVIKLYHL